MSREILDALVEDIADREGEKPYELERSINHRGCGENPDDILEILAQFGY